MPSIPPLSDGSINLHEVLEAEFEKLHGSLPEGYGLPEDSDTRLKNIWSAVHGLKEKRSALCISGGGIRSATFALGVLQGLARCGLLDKFHYLSTVSGGGYIGSWLTAWINRASDGIHEVSDKLAQSRTGSRPNPEPKQIQDLRSYSNYLSPKLGILSADTWTLVATYVRNLILNWFIFIPLLGLVLTVPWIYISVLMIEPPPLTDVPLWAGSAFLLIAIVVMGLSRFPLQRRSNGGDKGVTRSEAAETSAKALTVDFQGHGQAYFLTFCLAPLFISAVLLTTHWAWFTRYGRQLPTYSFLRLTPPHPSVLFICFGIVIHIVAWFLSLQRAHGFRLKEFVAVVVSGGAGGWFLWLVAAKVFPEPVAKAELYCCFAVPVYLTLFYLAITVFTGLSSRWTKDEDREWSGRASGWLLITVVAWTVISSLVIFGPLLLSWTYSTLTAGGLAGLLTMVSGLSNKIPANDKEKGKASLVSLVLSKITIIASIVFAAVVLILIVVGLTSLMKSLGNILKFHWNLGATSAVLGRSVEYLNVLLYTPIRPLLVLSVALGFFGVAMAFLIDPNRFSLHALYRNRLIRAYLGASNAARSPHPFTGFDENDNIWMRSLWQQDKFGARLMPIINIALNLVGGARLAWQERKAESFTISPLHCGSNAVGYRLTGSPDKKYYGGKEGISLGTALTISGAAASPNMGYHSSPIVAFMLTLLNVRLGAWLGNPGTAGKRTYHLGYPNLSIRPIIGEAFGLTDDTSPYVYLSDGGHFENLGLYEMVLRRCHYVVVSDAGQDPKCSFVDLGEAIRKIRIDLGIPIEFDEMFIYARCDNAAQNKKGRSCAIGRIQYSVVDGDQIEDGVLIYIKPACYGDEPRDIFEYSKRSPLFPHETTLNQFFTESQFESYRMLGVYTMRKLCANMVGSFPDFITEIQNHLSPAPSPRIK
jgi:Patatin-like phospholipase